jgi:hypothetical protein
MLTQEEYFAHRAHLTQNLEAVTELERRYMDFLVKAVSETAPQLHADFSRSRDLVPCWISYPPKQRGRAPIGDSQPWSEVGEKSLSFNLLHAIASRRSDVTFPGLPFGADVRFATSEVLVHFDIKLTGPRDNVNEVVVPPQQVSGDGSSWDKGVLNSPFRVQGPRSGFLFQPKLPPFYVLDNQVLPCLTFFLKAVYSIHGLGEQPLEYLEVACVPNGLLMFEGPTLANTEGLLIPGKDDQSVRESDKRTRIRLYPLASIESGWRCRQIKPIDEERLQWQVQPRPAVPVSVRGNQS